MIRGEVSKGFTLIEILVVMAIVTLLAAIIFPVAKTVRDSGRISSCASNLSQIGKAISMYVSDHNERYPLVGYVNGCTWVDSIYPYVKSTKVFICPSVEYGGYIPGCAPPNSIPDSSPPALIGGNGSYDMVSPFLSVTPNPSGSGTLYLVEQKSLSSIRYRFPASTILLLDGRDNTYIFHTQNAAVNPGIDPIRTVDDLKDGGVLPVHRNGVNLLYVDDHVKWQPLEALTSTPMWRPDGREASPAPTPAPTP
ncbi:MAG: type II secretion system protein, partial [Proteobacteria bacterium]